MSRVGGNETAQGTREKGWEAHCGWGRAPSPLSTLGQDSWGGGGGGGGEEYTPTAGVKCSQSTSGMSWEVISPD